MPVHARRTGWVYATALSWRVLVHRFSFVFFLAFSIGILFIGHARPNVVEHIRARAMDGLAPVFDVVSRPLVMVDQLADRIHSYRNLMLENEQLKTEVETLRRWQNVAVAMERENAELRGLLNYKVEPAAAFISARVIADTGSAYVHSFVVTAGRVDGVREGMAAMTGEGLVGRVVEVGDWTSRVLSITDMNSRLPVMVAGTSDHAILSGNNGVRPKLMYLPQEADVKPGMRVLTSGHGGIFPPNLPVGVVEKVERGEVEVAPLANLSRVNQIRLVDFNLAAGAVNPIATKIQSATQSR